MYDLQKPQVEKNQDRIKTTMKKINIDEKNLFSERSIRKTCLISFFHLDKIYSINIAFSFFDISCADIEFESIKNISSNFLYKRENLFG